MANEYTTKSGSAVIAGNSDGVSPSLLFSNAHPFPLTWMSFSMRECAEFRIPESNAKGFLNDNEGTSVTSSVRKLVIDTNSDRFREIGLIDAQWKSNGRAFYTSCKISRSFSSLELQNAILFSVRFSKVWEMAGEEHGTLYDESKGCPVCGTGSKQVGPLLLPMKKVSKSADFIKTIAGEYLISKRARELFEDQQISGSVFSPVLNTQDSCRESNQWYQLSTSTIDLEISSSTKVGIDLFDEDIKGTYRCTCGQLLGLNLLSPVILKAEQVTLDDICSSRQFIGIRKGLLRQEKVIFATQKLRQMAIKEKLRGLEFDVAYFEQKLERCHPPN